MINSPEEANCIICLDNNKKNLFNINTYKLNSSLCDCNYNLHTKCYNKYCSKFGSNCMICRYNLDLNIVTNYKTVIKIKDQVANSIYITDNDNYTTILFNNTDPDCFIVNTYKQEKLTKPYVFNRQNNSRLTNRTFNIFNGMLNTILSVLLCCFIFGIGFAIYYFAFNFY